MFGKLKEKLKGALSVFSSKAEEEAEVKPIEVEVSVEEKKSDFKKTKGPKEKKGKETFSQKKSPKSKVNSTVSSTSNVKPEPEIVVSEEPEEFEEPEDVEEPEKILEKKLEEEHLAPLTVDNEELKEAEKEKAKEEKKGFFGRLFSRKKEESEEGEVPVKEEKVKPVIEEREQERPTEILHKKEPVIVRSKRAAEEEKRLAAKEAVLEEVEKKGFFGKIKQTLTTKTISTEKFEELFWDLELVLLENNVSVEVINRMKEDLMKELVDKPLPRDVMAKIEEVLKRTLKDILSFEKVDLLGRIKQKDKKPFVIAFFGINGAGKTTSIAKLTHYLKKNKISVVLAACDTFRAAAIQQLEEHAEKLGVKIIKQDYGSDAAAVAFDAIKYAEKNKVDVVLIDTAGRLHSNTNLMAELEKIIRVTKPDMKLFVGESITGNDCIEQARQFNELVEMDGAILTKADVDEKGGAPLSISYTIKKPILFLGVGQAYEDFEEFNADVMVKRLGF
ncbi:signal recognition particle-docking protein FtsY [Candidatus Woesearchaeota archaeon]|nr:signal recognition particle-docking protein FtsY [Candidatus Woesearchaeota archaeon]